MTIREEKVLKFGLRRKVRHFKGDVYIIVGFALHTEDEETLVLYKKIGGANKPIFARPLEMFASLVDKEKYPNATQKYRMQFIK